MYELTNLDVTIRLSVALLCGFVMGFERQINNSIDGIHTNVLVCVGSCLFVFVSYCINEINSPSRIAVQVVTGVGFLGLLEIAINQVDREGQPLIKADLISIIIYLKPEYSLRIYELQTQFTVTDLNCLIRTILYE